MQVLFMSQDEVAAFSARWEDANGKSLDSRWQCFQWRYQDWLEKIKRIEVFSGLPQQGTQYRWMLCRGGLFWLRGRYAMKTFETSFPGEPCFDDWYAVCHHFPALVIAPDEEFFMGYDCLDHQGIRQVVFETYQRQDGDLGYASFPGDSEVLLASARVRAELGIPENVEIGHGFF
jgi:hypothetical protein